MSTVQTYEGKECRELLLQGVEKIAIPVIKTLGPEGRTVLIGMKDWPLPKSTKDGVTVSEYTTGDMHPVKKIGMQIIKDAAREAYLGTGDGTTTATLLGWKIMQEGNAGLADGLKPSGIIKGINKAIDTVVKSLVSQSTKIEVDGNEIWQIATIAANNDPILGGLIQECITHVGYNGITSVNISNDSSTYIELKKGMRIEGGYISADFINNPQKQQVVIDNPLILIYDRKISSLTDIGHLIKSCLEEKRSLLIMAEDVDSEALSTLILNCNRKKASGEPLGVHFAAIKTPMWGARKEYMDDIALFTGTFVISEDAGKLIEKTILSDLGGAEKVIIDKYETTFIHGIGNQDKIKERMQLILDQRILAPTEKVKEFYDMRYASISGLASILYIGKTTGMEMSEKRDRIDDALKSAKSALEEGVIPGGGFAFIKAIKDIDQLTGTNEEIFGFNVIRNVLQEPLLNICSNAGINGQEIVLEVMATSKGYNAKSGTFENLTETGVIDSTKVVRTALEKAASVACTFLSTDCVVVEI